jgi:F-type H+-transporting ATPase subunit b
MFVSLRRLVVIAFVSMGLFTILCCWQAPVASAANGESPAAEMKQSLGTAIEKSEEAMHEEPNPLAVDADLAVWTFVVFLVLFAVLWKFAWGPIAKALDKREHHIADNIEAARRAQDDAKGMLAEYERKLAGAADQVRQMLEEARRDAEGVKQQIVAEAKSAAQQEHERGMRDIRRATDAAVEELSQRSADLAIELAGKVIGTKLTQQERSQLVQDSLNKFAAVAPSQN